MGRVYRANDETLDRQVAIKVLPPDRRAPERVAALRREARAMAQLQHPNVVQVFTVGADAGLVYIAMELIRGGDLRKWLSARTQSAEEILERFIAAGRGLEAAHEAGVIHRDFKPSNVLMSHDGAVKVGDFGLARVWHSGLDDTVSQRSIDPPSLDPGITFTGSAVGTPTFMPPEQHRGNTADEQSDQYSFCVALWYALAGKSPFGGTSKPEALLLKKERGAPPLPRSVAVSRSVANAIERGMMPRAHDRWASMRELLAALQKRSTSRVWVTTALGAAAIASIVGLNLATAGNEDASCSIDDAHAHWDAQRRRVETAFTSANVESSVQSRALNAMDTYARDWAAARDDSCTSRAARPCLAERGAAFSALVRTFTSDEQLDVDHVFASITQLPPVSECVDDPPAAKPKHPQVLMVEAMKAAGRYKGALTEAEALLADPNLDDTALADAQYLRGELLARLERSDDALDVLESAYFAASRVNRNETAFQAAIRLAFLHQEVRHDFERTRSWLDQARAAADRGGGSPRLLATLENAEGTFAESQGRYDDAERAFAKAFAWHREAGSDEGSLAPTYNNRASARAGKGDMAGAIADTEHAVALFEASLGPAHPNILIALSNLTGYLHRDGAYARELEVCDRLDTLVLARFGKIHPEYSSSLNQRGLALKRLGRLAEAEKAMVQSIDIREQLGDVGPRAAIAWVNLGAMYLEQERLDDAEVWFARGRETMEAQLGASHPATAQVLGNVAQLRYAQGRLEEAEALLDRTLETLTQVLGADQPAVAPFRVFRGQVRAAAGKHAEAREDLEMALTVLQRAGGPAQELADAKLALAPLVRDSAPDRTRTLANAAAEQFDELDQPDRAAQARSLLDPS